VSSDASVVRGEILTPAVATGTQAHRFLAHVAARDPGVRDYATLHNWSVDHFDDFWGEVSSWFDVTWHDRPRAVVEPTTTTMPGHVWWPGGTLNWAERVVEMARGHGDEVAIIAHSNSRSRVELTWTQLLALAAHYRSDMESHGVTAGDRVAVYLPNVPEAVALLVAAASLGAVYSSCPPEFGAAAVTSRFGQIEPKVLYYCDGYVYGTKRIDKSDDARTIIDSLPGLRAAITIDTSRTDFIPGGNVTERSGTELPIVPVPANHPLYVLYSSGTTGLPKAIVHGHGGILHEHLKMLALHHDLGRGDRFMWFSTTGWMMWNYLVSGLCVGSTIVLFDGDPGHPDLSTLWSIAAAERVKVFGVGATFIANCMKAGLRPGSTFDLSSLRVVGSTGSPLVADGFRWVKNEVGRNVAVHSISGGTDVCSAFLGMSPLLPVRAGEIACAALGGDVRAFRDDGSECRVGETGELVLTTPMPSMPVALWNDPDGSKLRAAYFSDYPGVWRHGDWITLFDDGSSVVSGRSDATLNRGGVRLGTSEFYGLVESLEFVADSLVVHLTDRGGDEGRLVLFVRTVDGTLDDARRTTIRTALRTQLSPRHVPDAIFAVRSVPRTLSGKKLEIPAKKVLQGSAIDDVCSRSSLVDPTSLDDFVALRGELGD
jgi:acetoacetyl-CoA synthetase